MTKKLVKMTELGDDPILALEIPTVNVLCQDLGLNADSQKKFRDSVTNWRKGYRTAFGKKGTALLDWDSYVERYDLGVMAQQFVETSSNAHDFWPSDGGSSAQGSLRYPNDKVKILQLLRRFMWRQNKYLAANNRRGNNSINGHRSGSEEEYSPLSPSQTSKPSPQSTRKVRSRLPDYGFIAKDRSSYDTATGLRPNSAREMADLPVGNRNGYRLPGEKSPALPKSVPASTGHPSDFRPGVTNSALTNGSSGKGGNSTTNEENIQSQSSRQKRSDPRLLGSDDAESAFNKWIHTLGLAELVSTFHQTSIPAELDSTPLRTPTNSPSIFHPGDTNSTLTTGSSGLSLTRGSSANTEENTQSQSLRQKRIYPRLSGSNDIESESNKRMRISMPSELQSTTSQADPHTPAIRPEVNVLVVESSGPRITIKKWPGATLKGRTLKSVFDEVSSMFPEQTLLTIKFQLQTQKKEDAMECLIGRDDDEAFEFMMQKFNERIRERIRAGETRFKLVLEPERGVEGATGGAVSEASGSEENYV